MSATGSNRVAAPADAGFTLVEVLVAIGIVALLASVTVSLWPHRGGSVALQTAAQGLAADLRLARGRAIAENRAIAIEVAASTARYAGVDIAEGSAAAIAFQPDGSSRGGRIELVTQGRQAIIQVERLTGRVMVAN